MKGLNQGLVIGLRPGRLVALLLGLSVLVAACGVETPTNPPLPTATTAPPTATTAPATTDATATTAAGTGSPVIEVTLNEWSIEPKTIDATAGVVTFKVTNKGKFPHNFSVISNGQELKKTKNIPGGQSDTLEVDLSAGAYQTICDIPGHKDQGMVGTLTTK
jgi:uncharacterized cupredoxin-like copper-binding protein